MAERSITDLLGKTSRGVGIVESDSSNLLKQLVDVVSQCMYVAIVEALDQTNLWLC